jgi:hypothetical protein
MDEINLIIHYLCLMLDGLDRMIESEEAIPREDLIELQDKAMKLANKAQILRDTRKE